MLEIVNSIIFLAIGYFLGRYHHNQEVFKDTMKSIKKIMNHPKSGVIDYPTQEEIDYRESGEEKTDEARTKLFEQFFKP